MKEPSKVQIRVSEIFASLQGESSWAGRPCAFIRLAGCPMRCVWCDTAYAFTGGEDWTVADAVEKVKTYGLGLVEVTGGEPLAQDGSILLMEELLKAGFETLLETSGAFDIGPVPSGVHRIVDVKCPGSGEEKKNRWENLGLLTDRDEVKFVARDPADYDYAKDVIRRYSLENRCGILLSPVAGEMDPALLAEWMLRDRLKARLNLQAHKVIWPREVKGR